MLFKINTVKYWLNYFLESKRQKFWRRKMTRQNVGGYVIRSEMLKIDAFIVVE